MTVLDYVVPGGDDPDRLPLDGGGTLRTCQLIVPSGGEILNGLPRGCGLLRA